MRRTERHGSVVSNGCGILGIAACLLLFADRRAVGDPAAPVEAWRTSPFHGAISGATGQPIPCLCSYRGRSFKLGEQVCMLTYKGVLLTRCDMLLNNTTWVPTDEPCTISRAPSAPPQSRKS